VRVIWAGELGLGCYLLLSGGEQLIMGIGSVARRCLPLKRAPLPALLHGGLEEP